MARAARRKVLEDEIRARMDLLGRYILQMEPEEIWGLLDTLFPKLSEDEKEDLWGLLICRQRGHETEGRPLDEVFDELEQDRGLSE